MVSLKNRCVNIQAHERVDEAQKKRMDKFRFESIQIASAVKGMQNSVLAQSMLCSTERAKKIYPKRSDIHQIYGKQIAFSTFIIAV